ncbi:MAG: FAD:protein FMN transferase [Coriobacteriales bacterium]|jgi:thiamine biosynthesis lipoprotein|nr:FAD:protein FMN transferase [Coriobacteriales bacterium]
MSTNTHTNSNNDKANIRIGSNKAPDLIPMEDQYWQTGPDESGLLKANFFAFNTIVSVISYGSVETSSQAFAMARDECRRFERLFSRTLPHSDIANINQSGGNEVEIDFDTHTVLKAAQYYCQQSQGMFDITIGPVVALWDFQQGIIPNQEQLTSALCHVDWQGLHLRRTTLSDITGDSSSDDINTHYYAHLDDPKAAIDLGGIAKGYIADRLAEVFRSQELNNFCINLGGNTLASGKKPDGSAWRVGVQDPQNPNAILQTIDAIDVSVVTSGVYERCFIENGILYHHILNPKTGYPVATDVAGVTVVAQASIDAEGYSTTLLAMGIKPGTEFVKQHPEIIQAVFVNFEGHIVMVNRS